MLLLEEAGCWSIVVENEQSFNYIDTSSSHCHIKCHCVKCHCVKCHCVKYHCVKYHCVKCYSIKCHYVKVLLC